LSIDGSAIKKKSCISKHQNIKCLVALVFLH
jgi:hypothetical protein